MIQSTDLIYSVSQLCRETRLLLEGHFLTITVEGEISNLACPASGHIYFSLKDNKSQIQCAMFRPQLRKIGFKPENGQQVMMKARVSLYEPRGNFQLIGEYLEPVGEGLLRQKFERLKNKLYAEGLFDEASKKTLPNYPKQVALITSASGAAVHDVISVLNKRFPLLPILVYPTSVQGANAKNEVVKAIQLANSRNDCDVIILSRGGGSLEDLWSFNEEVVARAIFNSDIPIISAIGHEVDVTIADFVADLRAPTPSAAAEMVSPEQDEYFSQLKNFQLRLNSSIQQMLANIKQQLNYCRQQLESAHPGRQLQFYSQRLDDCSQRLFALPKSTIRQHQLRLSKLHAQLIQQGPLRAINEAQKRLDEVRQDLALAIQDKLHHSQTRLAQYSATLDVISPLATLARGYSITKRDSDNAILIDAQQAQLGEQINITLHNGSLLTTINEINIDEN